MTDKLLYKAISGEFLNIDEALELYINVPLSELMFAASEVRFKKHPNREVTWIIDRNVNYSNICISGCKFCNFYRSKKNPEAHITSFDEYKSKIDELISIGGDQLLLQGGMHPDFDIHFYENLFSTLKKEYPEIKLHALGPPEVWHIAKVSNLDIPTTLQRLIDAGLDSLPGAGAEILCDRVRQQLSPIKATANQWKQVMTEAHKLNMITSATMMFGHIETIEERMQHILFVRDIQNEKPKGNTGFISFIPWIFSSENTVLERQHNVKCNVSSDEYIKTIAISRLLLPNIDNIQASWLTVGKGIGQVCLHAGANDFGSIMIEENVVSVAGSNHKFDVEGIKQAITEAGFTPIRRNQKFEKIL